MQVRVDRDRLVGRAVSAYAAAEIGGLVEEATVGGPLAVIAVDIPIGLPDAGRRQADILARKAVGPLWRVGVHDAGPPGPGSTRLRDGR